MRGSNGLKKLLLLSSFILLSNSSELGDVLSENRSRLLESQMEQSKLEASKLEKSWINPIRIQYSQNYSTQFDKTIESGQFIISVDQPIFKMGGIWEAIKYAKVTGEANRIDIELRRRELIGQAISTLFNLHKSKLQLQKLKLTIKNDELDIIIQRDSYKAGVTNRTLYDRALLKRNQDITSKLELEMQITKLENDFSLLSDKSPEELELPNFTMIDGEEYQNSQLEIERDRLRTEQKRHKKFMTLTKYLPELSINGRYVNEDKNPLFKNANIKENYYTYGFKVSIPIDINFRRDTEISKVEYLNAMISLEEQKKRVANEYRLVKKRLEIINKKIELSRQDAENYESMLISAQALERAGDGTHYDTEIVRNSMQIRLLDQAIYRYDIQLELLKLYTKVNFFNSYVTSN